MISGLYVKVTLIIKSKVFRLTHTKTMKLHHHFLCIL